MLHIWYAIAFQFDSFLFFTFFKTFQRLRLGLGLAFGLALRLVLGLALGLLRFCQACCRRHLHGKTDTAFNLS